MGYEDQFNAMKAAQEAMKTTPRPYEGMASRVGAANQSSDKKPMTAEQDARRAEMLRKLEEKAPTTKTEMGKKKGGKVCGMKKGGAVKARGCGCAQRGLTKGKMR